MPGERETRGALLDPRCLRKMDLRDLSPSHSSPCRTISGQQSALPEAALTGTRDSITPE